MKNALVTNLCEKQNKGSLENAIKRYVLNNLGKTSKCPIKKARY